MADFNGIVIPDGMLENVSGGSVVGGVSRDDPNGIVVPFNPGGSWPNASLSAIAYQQTCREWDEFVSLIPENHPALQESGL
jgi:hypothetical protein